MHQDVKQPVPQAKILVFDISDGREIHLDLFLNIFLAGEGEYSQIILGEHKCIGIFFSDYIGKNGCFLIENFFLGLVKGNCPGIAKASISRARSSNLSF